MYASHSILLHIVDLLLWLQFSISLPPKTCTHILGLMANGEFFVQVPPENATKSIILPKWKHAIKIKTMFIQELGKMERMSMTKEWEKHIHTSTNIHTHKLCTYLKKIPFIALDNSYRINGYESTIWKIAKIQRQGVFVRFQWIVLKFHCLDRNKSEYL